MTREQMLAKVQRGMPGSFEIKDPVARQCFESLREIVLMLAREVGTPAAADAKAPAASVEYGAAGSIVLSQKKSFSFSNDNVDPGPNTVYGTDADGKKGYKPDPDFTGIGAATEPPVIPDGINSIEKVAGGYQLVGDAASPGNDKFYGTTSAGVKGYRDVPAFTRPAAPSSPASRGSTTEADLASSAAFDPASPGGNDGVAVIVSLGSYYDHTAATPVLKDYRVTLTWPNSIAPKVSAASTVEIDTPQA